MLHRLRDFSPTAHKERQKLEAEDDEEEDDDDDDEENEAQMKAGSRPGDDGDDVDTGLQTSSKDDDDDDKKKRKGVDSAEDIEETSKVSKDIEHFSHTDLDKWINTVRWNECDSLSIFEFMLVCLQAYEFYHKKALTIEVCNADGLLQRVHFMDKGYA